MITVRCFAHVREILGVSTQDLPYGEALNAGGVLALIAGERLQDLPAQPLVAVNKEHASLQTPIADGDEVAFFPPVSGG